MAGPGISKDCDTHKTKRVALKQSDLDQQAGIVSMNQDQRAQERIMTEEILVELHLKKEKAIELGRTTLASNLQDRIANLEAKL
jgi:hypothetical protein